MSNLPVVFVPGLCVTGAIHAHQVAHLGQSRAVMLANHWRADTMGAIADQILAEAPDRFALVGTSMGGYLAFQMFRRAPERVGKLVLISTSARPDTPERSAQRRQQVAFARRDFRAGVNAFLPVLVNPARREDQPLIRSFHDMADAIAGAELQMIVHCEHMCPMEMPETVTRLRTAFVSRSCTPAPPRRRTARLFRWRRRRRPAA